jgi:HSP20 family protein
MWLIPQCNLFISARALGIVRGTGPREGGKRVMKNTNLIEKKDEQPTELQYSQKGQELSPFGLMRRFAENMERMFEGFGDFRLPGAFGPEMFPFRTEMKNVEWMPPIEVVQNNGQVTVRCDLPGMNKDDIKVELKDEILTISGERHEEKKDERDGYYRSERSYGSFYRQLPLPPGVKTDTAEATFRDGVLAINMRKTEKETPVRKLEIKEATAHKSAAKAAA